MFKRGTNLSEIFWQVNPEFRGPDCKGLVATVFQSYPETPPGTSLSCRSLEAVLVHPPFRFLKLF